MTCFVLCLILLPDYGVDKYDIGTGFGHFGIAVEDVSFYWKFLADMFST